jgi:1-acyl-sn-glycerol-3-phosphate acyltransferase
LRAARSLFFFLVYGLYLVFFFGLVQRVVIWPLALLLPKRRRAIVGAWFRLVAHSTLGLARHLGGVALDMEGALPPAAFVVVMNHQSLLDIPIAYALVSRPYPVIPTRAYYARGIPGVSLLLRMAGHPLVRQTTESRREDVLAIGRAAEAVYRGDQSILIYPEGHRSRDGEIGPFMRAGLRAILSRAQRPVYAIVVDGLWQSRTTAEALVRFSDSQACVRVLGPFPAPAADQVDAFIDETRERMITKLREMRAQGSPSAGAVA